MTTASALCAVLDLHVGGKLPSQGFVRQEQVALEEFLGNRFGRCYACPAESALAPRTNSHTLIERPTSAA
jgi:hypothetical protein